MPWTVRPGQADPAGGRNRDGAWPPFLPYNEEELARAAGLHPCQARTSSRCLPGRAGVACLCARPRLEAVRRPCDPEDVTHV
jgi:hypothetical protein